MIQPVIAIHGGAGAMSRAAMSPEKEQEYLGALKSIVQAGQAVLAAGGAPWTRSPRPCACWRTARCSTPATVRSSPAPRRTSWTPPSWTAPRCARAPSPTHRVRNPIFAARKVMENSKHVFFVGEGAEDFARQEGLELVDRPFSTEARREQPLRVQRETPEAAVLDHDGQAMVARGQPAPADPLDADKKFGTVGAVAVDAQGNLAAATSTGGITNKQIGRVGDAR